MYLFSENSEAKNQHETTEIMYVQINRRTDSHFSA